MGMSTRKCHKKFQSKLISTLISHNALTLKHNFSSTSKATVIDPCKLITGFCKAAQDKYRVYFAWYAIYIYIYCLTLIRLLAGIFAKFDINWVALITVTSHGRRDIPNHKQFDGFSIACSGKHQTIIPCSALLVPWPIYSPHKVPAAWKMIWCQDVILRIRTAM